MCCHNTGWVFFGRNKNRDFHTLHHVGVNLHCYGVNKTLDWCSHSCKSLHLFGVTITLTIFLCYFSNERFQSESQTAQSPTQLRMVNLCSNKFTHKSVNKTPCLFPNFFRAIFEKQKAMYTGPVKIQSKMSKLNVIFDHHPPLPSPPINVIQQVNIC